MTRPKRALIVDDSRVTRNFLSYVLKEADLAVAMDLLVRGLKAYGERRLRSDV